MRDRANKKDEGSPSPLKEAPSGMNLQKEFFNLQIKSLKEKLERLEERCATLTKENSELAIELKIQKTDKKEICEFLKGKLEASEKEVMLMQERMAEFTKKKDQIEQELEAKLHTEISKSEDMSLKYSKDLAKLRQELQDLNEFKIQKVDIEAELEELKQTKENESKRHKDKLYELEREVVKERDRLKKEMETQIHDTRRKLLEMANAKLDATTKMTMIENDKINNELKFQSQQTEGLMEENAKLRDENKHLRRKIDVLSQLEQELSKKNSSSQTMIRQLSTKLQKLPGPIENKEPEFNKEKEKDLITSNLEKQVAALTKDLSVVQNQYESSKEETENQNNLINDCIAIVQKYLSSEDENELAKIILQKLSKPSNQMRRSSFQVSPSPTLLSKTYKDFAIPPDKPLKSPTKGTISTGSTSDIRTEILASLAPISPSKSRLNRPTSTSTWY